MTSYHIVNHDVVRVNYESSMHPHVELENREVNSEGEKAIEQTLPTFEFEVIIFFISNPSINIEEIFSFLSLFILLPGIFMPFIFIV